MSDASEYFESSIILGRFRTSETILDVERSSPDFLRRLVTFLISALRVSFLETSFLFLSISLTKSFTAFFSLSVFGNSLSILTISSPKGELWLRNFSSFVDFPGSVLFSVSFDSGGACLANFLWALGFSGFAAAFRFCSTFLVSAFSRLLRLAYPFRRASFSASVAGFDSLGLATLLGFGVSLDLGVVPRFSGNSLPPSLTFSWVSSLFFRAIKLLRSS